MGELFQELLSISGVISLLTLTLMEIILGIDNIIFISILASKLPKEQQSKARTIGLSLAFVFRVGLLTGISWLVGLQKPLLTIMSFELSGRDLILLGGGLFLLANTTTEIHSKIEGDEDEDNISGKKVLSLSSAILQIILLDIIFSFDSILTAVGLARNIIIMVLAVFFSLLIMLRFAKYIGDYVESHPTIKMLALSFLMMIGVLLVLEALHQEVPKAYVYFAMGFSLAVEFLNMRIREKPKQTDPVVIKDEVVDGNKAEKAISNVES